MLTLPRPFQNDDDLALMQEILVSGRQAQTAAYYIHSGDLRWWYYYVTPANNPRPHTVLWESSRLAGKLDGWAMVSPQWRTFDVYARPGLQGSPEHEAMLAWAEGKITEIVRLQGENEICTMWVSERDLWLVAYLEGHGYACSDRCMDCLEQPLGEHIPETRLPEGYVVRPVAGESEIEARAWAQSAAFESSLPFERYLKRYRSFMRSPAYTPGLDLAVFAPGGSVAAFCICWVDPQNRVGLFEPVGTHPDFQRQGLGKAVIAEGLRRLKASGMTSAMVCVENDNLAAIRLYSSAGFLKKNKILTFAKQV